MKSKKEMLLELNDILDKFNVAKGPELISGPDPISQIPNLQLRNYRKKMVRLFCSFSPERQESELEAFRVKLKEKQNLDNNKEEIAV